MVADTNPSVAWHWNNVTALICNLCNSDSIFPSATIVDRVAMVAMVKKHVRRERWVFPCGLPCST